VTILLVRHARAGRRERWHGDDRLRPLSKKGRAQARALPGLLTPWTAGRRPVLLSSPWIRCIETLGPLGAEVGAPIVEDEALAEGMGRKAVEAVGSWLCRDAVVACTHGDVVEEILGTLLAAGVDVDAEPTAAKGAVWVLQGEGGSIRTARYLPPPT
jgi:8-oxo-dGTP diphosphatase